MRTVLGVILICAAATRLAVLEDEAYYWTWSRALTASYFDHPPMIAWLLRGAEEVTRQRFVALRSVSLACMAVTAWAVVATAGRLVASAGPSCRAEARRLAVWGLGTGLSFSVGLLPATPDSALAASLSVAAYSMVRATDRNEVPWAAVAGLFTGLAVLSKLPALVVIAGATCAVVVPSTVAKGLSRRTWISITTGVAVFIAVVAVWLMAAGDPTTAVSFQARRFVGGATRWWLALPMTFGGALLVVGPAVTVALMASVARPLPTAARALFSGAMAVFAACVVAVGLGTGELNWLLPVLVLGAPVAAATVAGTPRARHFAWACGLQGMVAAAVLVHIIHPLWPWSPPRDRTLRSAGWRSVASEVERMAAAFGARTLVTDGYQWASLLRYHQSDRLVVFEQGNVRPSQYDLWPRPQACAGDPALMVRRTRDLPEGWLAAGPSSVLKRQRAGRVIGDVVVTPVRAAASHGTCPPREGR